jgi:ankyrin repeat protein
MSNVDEIKALLESIIDIDKYNNTKQHLLIEASVHGNTNIVKFLLNTSIEDIDQLDEFDNTALFYAVVNDNVEIIKLLFKNGADSELLYEDYSSTILQIAVSQTFETFKTVLIYGDCDLNIIDDWGYTALHYAVERGDLLAAKLLLDRGADVNSSYNKMRTPLHVASESKNYYMVELLLKYNPNVCIKDIKGKTAIYYGDKKIRDIIKRYIRNQAFINIMLHTLDKYRDTNSLFDLRALRSVLCYLC